VTYASPLGSAPEISEAIAAELRSGGHTAEVADMTNVVSLDSFTAVVIGILVYAGAYGLGDIGNFTKIRFSEQLTRMPVAVFIIGLLPEGMPPNVEYVMTNMKNALEPVTPAAMVLFCGILDRKNSVSGSALRLSQKSCRVNSRIGIRSGHGQKHCRNSYNVMVFSIPVFMAYPADYFPFKQRSCGIRSAAAAG
jgi:menaquinone-dependent protoporphyrinogen IX oxidase